MNNTNKLTNYLKTVFLNLGVVYFISIVIAFINGGDFNIFTEEFLKGQNSSQAMFKLTLALIAVISLVYFANKIYRANNLSLLSKTILAYGISITGVIIFLNYLKLFSSKYRVNIIINLVLFSIIYIIYWIISYQRVKKDIEQVNKRL
ncbi:DUF3021 family protein [Anaerococcus sp. Marseille-P3625]|uniref:DUF3021 family protein n=1 Tax=Anaerococcus sp. Marseille-P3625 TaxID=1977277 RepID=UPI000C080E08|nr:DUF3021 family protein [Anaerococcus sp. Marseille-P3625]